MLFIYVIWNCLLTPPNCAMKQASPVLQLLGLYGVSVAWNRLEESVCVVSLTIIVYGYSVSRFCMCFGYSSLVTFTKLHRFPSLKKYI